MGVLVTPTFPPPPHNPLSIYRMEGMGERGRRGGPGEPKGGAAGATRTPVMLLRLRDFS